MKQTMRPFCSINIFLQLCAISQASMFEYSFTLHRQNLCICILKLIQGLLISKLNENIYNSEVKEKQISKYRHEYVCIIYNICTYSQISYMKTSCRNSIMDLLNQGVNGYLHAYRQTCMYADRPDTDLFSATIDRVLGSS